MLAFCILTCAGLPTPEHVCLCFHVNAGTIAVVRTIRKVRRCNHVRRDGQDDPSALVALRTTEKPARCIDPGGFLLGWDADERNSAGMREKSVDI